MASSDSTEPASFDVYAKSFIPQRLKDVNAVPAVIIPALPARGFDYEAYIARFAGRDLLSTYFYSARTGADAQALDTTRHHQHDVPALLEQQEAGRPGVLSQSLSGPESYGKYFLHGLRSETNALGRACEDHALYTTPICRSPTDMRLWMYSLKVPGLRESSLRIEIGDIVQLRQLHFDYRGEVLSRPSPPLDYPTTFQHDSMVWAIDRRHETLTLRVDDLVHASMLFNVRFTVQSARLQALNTALSLTHNMLNNIGVASGSENSWLRSMLFPDAVDGYYQKTLNQWRSDAEFYDGLINYEQSKAINTVLKEKYGPVPYIITGPPGTGKTKTLVELALQLLAADEKAHLLICAPSDPAADTLVLRLRAHLGPHQLLRVNSPFRSFPEVPNTILPFCSIDDGIFSLPPFTALMKRRAVVTTCRDAAMLSRAQVANRDLFYLERNLYSAIHPESVAHVPKLHWTALLMDEAAQAIEPEALIPMNVIAPPDEASVSEADGSWPLVVMAGDQHQLGPRTASKSPDIQTSLFARLLNRPFYRNHPLSRSQISNVIVRPLTQDMLPILRPAFTDLIRNYRSHPAILATPSAQFYNDTLEPEATDTNELLSWSGWRGRGWPVLFHHNQHNDAVERDGGGWYNVQEARIACDTAQSFIQASLANPEDICIMSPFHAQVGVIRKFARREYQLPGLNIGPLEAFQGLESRLVILCTTRTRNRFIDQDIAKGLGVIFEPKRFNVALTRARQGLIVIGNPAVLAKDDNWMAFLGFCQRNGLYDGLPEGSELIEQAGGGLKTSRLEKQMLLQQDRADSGLVINGIRKLGFMSNEQDTLWQSGLDAERAVNAADLDED